MDKTTKRNAADKIRPILAAMERSIDSARRRRLHTDDDQPEANNDQTQQWSADSVDREPTVDRHDELIAAPRPRTNGDPESRHIDAPQGDADKPAIGKARLKARPKRPSGFGGNAESPLHGARAG